MKKIYSLYTEESHTWAMITRDPDKPHYLIDTNEYLIIKNDQMIITDPGGIEIFPAVVSTLSTEYNPQNIQYIFASHQDPDVISSLSLWLDMNPKIIGYVCYLDVLFL